MAVKKTTKKTAAKKTAAKKTVKKAPAKKVATKKAAKKAPAKKTVKKAVPAKATKKVVKKVEPAKVEKKVTKKVTKKPTKKVTKKPVKKVEEPKPVVTREDRNPIGGLGKTAKIFLLISIIVGYVFILPLAWMLPMHIYYSKHITKKIKISTGYKICVLLFINIVPGILMLCDHKN